MVETTRPWVSSELLLGRRDVVFRMREDCQLDAGKEIMALRWRGTLLFCHSGHKSTFWCGFLRSLQRVTEHSHPSVAQ